jgi:periplasmic copper chaperone A
MKTTMKRLLSSTPASGQGSKAVVFGMVALAGFVVVGSTAAAAGGITIDKPWLRFIIKDRPAAGYFTLRNDTDRKIELTGASSSGCGMVMLHQSKETGGVDKMLPVKSVTVPAHGTLSFTPGSYHLMCMNPQSTVTVGSRVPVILKFADGKTMSADFPVKGPSG